MSAFISLHNRCLIGALLLAAASGCGMVAQNRNAQGIRYYNKGQIAVAQSRFEAARQANPQNADSYYNLGAIAHLQGFQTKNTAQLAQADSYYRQCLGLNPNHVDCHRGLAVLLAQTGHVDQAFESVKSWCVTSPQSADARVELARLYEEYGDLRTAELQLQQALQLDLNNPRVHASLGSVKEKQEICSKLSPTTSAPIRSTLSSRASPSGSRHCSSAQALLPATNLTPGTLRSAGAASFTNRNY